MDYKYVIDLVMSAKSIVFDQTLGADVHMKGQADFVTGVDLAISGYLKSELKAKFPEIGFMSEEDEPDLSERRWILDPIDGTTNLTFGYNMSSISLALYESGQVTFGVVYNPFNGELFTAWRGKGAYLNGQPLPAAPDREFCDCLVEFGAGSTHKELAEESFSIARTVFEQALDLRRICSTALAICYIAAGRLNGYYEKVIKPWDYAAAGLLLEECGGVMTDFDGEPLQYDGPTSIICGTKKAHERLLEIVGGSFASDAQEPVL